jgi:Zn-dependent M28 family amino/carboxypeptidase
MQVDFKATFHADDLMAYNTIAEIPGTDLKDEIVMLGAHLDSWHAGTGATDNGAGCAATMEAMRILTATGLRPRRTIRIGLWTGEEQGLLGSRAYVAKHLGEMTDARGGPATRPTTRPSSERPSTRPSRLTKRGGYETFCVYLNMDHGTGRIRGLYLQGNTPAGNLFRSWINPLSDLGVQTLSLAGTGGTDHVPFDAIGLPGFTMIQDPLEYWSRTHHTNADVFDRAQGDDLKQAATVLAAIAYQAAMAEEKVPRKSLR